MAYAVMTKDPIYGPVVLAIEERYQAAQWIHFHTDKDTWIEELKDESGKIQK